MFSWLFGKTAPKGVFVFKGVEGGLTPSEFGYWSVKLAIDSTSSTVKSMAEIDVCENLQDNLFHDPGIAHRHLILYDLSAHYVYCLAILNVSKAVLTEIFLGYEKGLTTMMGGAGKVSQKAMDGMLGFIRMYAQELYAEIKNPDSTENKSGLSSSALMVLREIIIAYEDDIDQVSQRLAEVALHGYVAAHGVLLIGQLKNDIGLEFKS